MLNHIKCYFNQSLLNDLWKRLSRAAFWSFSGAATQKILLLATSFLCMRILQKDGYGKLSIVRSTIQMFVLFGSVGMGSTATKFIAEFRNKNPKKLTSIYSIVILLAISSGLLAMLLVLCFASPIAIYLKDPELVHCVRVGAFLLFFSIINSIQTGILAGLERFKDIAIVAALGGIAEFICINLGAFYFSILGGLLGYGIGFLCLTVMNQFAISRSHYSELHYSWDSVTWFQIKEMLFFSIPLMGSSLMVSPVIWYSQTLLVRHSSFSELGIYSAADQWRLVLLFIPSALSRIVLPFLSNLNGKRDFDSYVKVLKANLCINAGATVGFFVIFSLLTPIILWFYGIPFSCVMTFITLAGSTIFASLAAVFGQAIVSQGKTWIGFFFNLGWGTMLICFAYVFLKLNSPSLALSSAMLLSYLLHTFFQSIYFFYFLKNVRTKHENCIYPES